MLNLSPAFAGLFLYPMKSLYSLFLENPIISTDTRKIEKGSIFFALKGPSFDGNQFAQNALDAGAVLAVIDDPKYKGENTFVVNDVLTALQDLAVEHRANLEIPVIGLTGSNGKTTTKEVIASVLATQYKISFTQGNLNNHIGVPLTLLSIPLDCEIAIIEMGANHQGEIEELCNLCIPTHGLITNYGKAHLEGFGGVEGVIKGKSELYQALERTEGYAIINGNDEIQMEKSNTLNRFVFGDQNTCDLKTHFISKDGFTGIEFNQCTAISNLMGDFQYSNLGFATAVGKVFGVSDDNIVKGIQAYIPKNNRAQIKKTENNALILDAYNANPSSTLESLKSFRNLEVQGDKWIILGDMFELGEYSEEEHQKVVSTALDYEFSTVIFVGNEYFKVKVKANHTNFFETKEELRIWLTQMAPKNKTILLKGSRGMALESLVDIL